MFIPEKNLSSRRLRELRRKIVVTKDKQHNLSQEVDQTLHGGKKWMATFLLAEV